MLGGPIIAGATLSRFFALHVFVIPGMLIGFVGLHLLMVIKLGINEWPMPGRLVKKSNLRTRVPRIDAERTAAPFVPYAVWKDLFFAAFVILAVAAWRRVLRPVRTNRSAGSDDHSNGAKPDYFFLWLYAVLSFLPASMETPALLIGPVHHSSARCFFSHFCPGEGEKKLATAPDCCSHRSCLLPLHFATFTHLAGYTPWSPEMNAWSSDPIPVRFLQHRTALESRALSFSRRSKS